MQLTSDAHGFSLAYHRAVGLSLVALAVILVAVIWFRRAPMRRRWTAFAAIVVAGWSGLYFATFQAKIGPQAASVYAFMQHDRVFSWTDAAEVYLEQRGGQDAQIVLVDRQRRVLAVNVADLDERDRERLVAYMVTRVASNGGHRSPTHVDRHAPARSQNLFNDQQI